MSASTPAPVTKLVKLACFTLAGGAVGFLLARYGLQAPGVRAALRSLSGWDLLAIPLAMVVVLAWHEAGHLAGGLSRGMRFLLFIAGPFGFFRGTAGVHFRWCFNLGTLGGIAAVLPDAGRPLKPQLQRLVWAGPGASLLLAVAAGVAFTALAGRPAAYALLVAALSGAIFLVTALPFRSGGFMSDGMQLLQLRRDPAMVERRSRLVGIVGLSLSGVRPRELDPALLAEAQSLTGPEATFDIGVWTYTMAHHLDAGDVAAASAWLDRIEARFDAYPDGFRQALATELALFEGLYRGRLEQARGWLAQARGGLVDATRRHLSEAAVAWRAGDSARARDQLKRAEAARIRSMDPGMTRLSSDQIASLEALIDAGAVKGA